MTAKDSYKVALNILARTGINGDLIGEYAKTMSTLHGLSSQEQLTNMQNMAQNTPNNALGGMNAPESSPTTPNDPNVLNQPNDQNQPPMQNEGQGALNLPQ